MPKTDWIWTIVATMSVMFAIVVCPTLYVNHQVSLDVDGVQVGRTTSLSSLVCRRILTSPEKNWTKAHISLTETGETASSDVLLPTNARSALFYCGNVKSLFMVVN